ncbi:sensor histidine kinase [Lacinutrix jangbogonensis]|uniref:sensor histidine kinase n=1 Tax=Lacinutrix jangbogonensis TaxID=1469557 RepID=UPI00068AC1E7|nr:sensor histidine kinase [Lacinutrix jangbogonensis]
MNNSFSQYINVTLQKRWLGHVIFWMLLLLCYTLAMKDGYGSISESFNRNVILLFPQIIASYYLIYFLNPTFLYKKKYVLFGILFLIGTYVFSILARVLVIYVVEELYREPPFRKESLLEIASDVKRLYQDFFHRVYLSVFLFACVKLIKERFEEKSRAELLKKEKIIAELNFMKAQIHPHFLFNTLNNLYALTLQKSEKASETVLKLSEMLDYMLYKCNENSVTIAEEIQLIQNYIDLEQLRYGNRLELVFNKNIDDPQTKIAPLILVSLIENAFKHGASGAITIPKIRMEIGVKNKQLLFSIFNTKPEQVQKDITNYKKGIGLVNTNSQLQLIYPNKYAMEIVDGKTSYKVKLEINLNT